METPLEPPGETPPAADATLVANEALEVLGHVLPLLSFEAKLASSIERGDVRIQLECAEPGRLIGRRGATVNELQFLVNRIVQRRHKNSPRIFLDVNGSHDKNKEELLTKARDLAQQVNRWGEAADLGPLTATDRQIMEEFFAGNHELEVVPAEPAPDARGLQRMRLQVRTKPGP